MGRRPEFYYAILSNKLTRAECRMRMVRSLVSRKNLKIIPVDGLYVLVRRIFFHEFRGDLVWRESVRRYHHPRVLRWLRKLDKKKARCL